MKWDEMSIGGILIAIGLSLFFTLPPPWWPDMGRYWVNVGLCFGAAFFIVGLALVVVAACRKHGAQWPARVVSWWDAMWTGKRVLVVLTVAALLAFIGPAAFTQTPKVSPPGPKPGVNEDNSNHIQGNPGPCSNNGGSGNTVNCPTYNNNPPAKPNQHEGVLTPGHGIAPSGITCNPKAAAVCVILGSNTLVVETNAITTVDLPGGGKIDFEVKPDKITITQLQIFDDTGSNIVHVDPDGYWVHPNNRMKPKKNRHSITVYDRKDVEALTVDWVNKNTLLITGIFRDADGHLICTITPIKSVCGNVTISSGLFIYR